MKTNKTFDLKVIGYGLAILYLTSFFIYLLAFAIPGFVIPAIILTGLFGILFVAAIGVAWLRSWGRGLLVTASMASAIYMLYLFIEFEDVVPMSYVFLGIVISLFFNQPRIKVRFPYQGKKEWRSVLIIDDDEMIIKTIRPILIASGFSVLSAVTGEEGLRIVNTQKPDIVILDVILPGVKGRDVCRTIKDNPETSHIPVIFLTSKESVDDIQAERAAGGTRHITKPVNPKTLVPIIKEVLDSPKRV